jgi:hypothetical protein
LRDCPFKSRATFVLKAKARKQLGPKCFEVKLENLYMLVLKATAMLANIKLNNGHLFLLKNVLFSEKCARPG